MRREFLDVTEETRPIPPETPASNAEAPAAAAPKPPETTGG
jgi:hypothetical protein